MAVGAYRGLQPRAARSAAQHRRGVRARGPDRRRGRACCSASRACASRASISRWRRWPRSSSSIWLFDRVPWFTNYAPSGVISAPPRSIGILRLRRVDTPVGEVPASCWRSWCVLALVAKNLVRGHIGRAWMAMRDMDVAAEVIGIRPLHAKLTGLRRQLVLLRRRRRAVGVRLPRRVGAAGLRPRPLASTPVHDHHRRPGQHPGLVPRRRLHRAAADPPEPRAADARASPIRPSTTSRNLRVDDLRRADRLLPDRRAAAAWRGCGRSARRSCGCGRSRIECHEAVARFGRMPRAAINSDRGSR